MQINGYDIFITPESIRPGEKWGPAIDRGLDGSAIFLALLTPYAVASAWVKDETYAAIEMANKDEMRLIFLDVQPCQIPSLWRSRMFLPFRGEPYHHHLEKLLDELDGKLSTDLERNSFVHKKTGLEFVRIPAGEFLYGYDAKQRHLPEYWISKTPVTQVVYQRYITANPKQDVPFSDEDRKKPYNWDPQKRIYPTDKDNHPVVLVSWYDAIAFCEWASLQLPTQEQWEKAARGTDGREYPWGNHEPTNKVCNFNEYVGFTTPVGQYSPQGNSPYGCVDMSGNVWEWCLNKYDEPEDISIDHSSLKREVRGGSWFFGRVNARTTFRGRNLPDIHSADIGFRVVYSSPSQ